MVPIILIAGLGLSAFLVNELTQRSSTGELAENRLRSDAAQFIRLKNIARGWDAYSRHPERARSGSPNGFRGHLADKNADGSINMQRVSSVHRGSQSLPVYPSWDEVGGRVDHNFWERAQPDKDFWVQQGVEEVTSWSQAGLDLPPTGNPSWDDLNSATLFDWKEPTIPYEVTINHDNTGWTFVWSEGGASFYHHVQKMTDSHAGVCIVNSSGDCTTPHRATPLHSTTNLPASITPGSIVYAWRNS